MLSTSTKIKRPLQALSLTEIVAGILLIGLGMWFLVLPKRSANSELNQKQIKNGQAIQQIQKDLNDLQKLSTQLTNEKQNLALLDEALPLDNRLPKVQVLIEHYVKSNGLQFNGFNPQSANSSNTQQVAASSAVTAAPVSTPGATPGAAVEAVSTVTGVRKLETIPIEITVTGTTEQIKNLLQTFETGGRIIDVTGIELSPADGTGVQAKIKLQTYSYVK